MWEAGEFANSAAEILEDLEYSFALELYKHNIKLWEKLIDNFIIQAKLHEIAEIYLKIADIYDEKLQDDKSKKENLLKSIRYLNEENKLLSDFNDKSNSWYL